MEWNDTPRQDQGLYNSLVHRIVLRHRRDGHRHD